MGERAGILHDLLLSICILLKSPLQVFIWKLLLIGTSPWHFSQHLTIPHQVSLLEEAGGWLSFLYLVSQMCRWTHFVSQSVGGGEGGSRANIEQLAHGCPF